MFKQIQFISNYVKCVMEKKTVFNKLLMNWEINLII